MCLCFVGQAKIEKRARRDLYEGSKLLDQHRKQVSFLFSMSRIHRSKSMPAKLRGNVHEGKIMP